MAVTTQLAGSVNWTTPKRVLDPIHELTPEIDLDPCHNPGSIVNAKNTFELPVDALQEDWDKFRSVFVNPPFGSSYLSADNSVCLSAKEFKEIKESEPVFASTFKKQTLKMWIVKCVETQGKWSKRAKFLRMNNDRELYLLIPSALSESHFHELIFPNANAICHFNGRIAYDCSDGKKSSPNMGSCLVYFGNRTAKFKEVLELHGHHVEVL